MSAGTHAPQSVIPQLRITDEAASLAFYVDGLGFTAAWAPEDGIRDYLGASPVKAAAGAK